MTQILERPDVRLDEQTSKGDDALAHYYDTRKYDYLESALNGTPIVAECGFTWVPNRDPLRLPICQVCQDIVDYRSMD